MTRTERNQNPAALLKDRHSRSGMNNTSEMQRKNGAGAHNWGSYSEEGEHEAAAVLDVRADHDDDMFDMDESETAGGKVIKPKQEDDLGDTAKMDGSNLPPREVIATSPTDSMSSVDSAKSGGRRMSNVTDEERDRARVYREGYKHNGPMDLAHIARTSYGIAQSPPRDNGFATSPNKGLYARQ